MKRPNRDSADVSVPDPSAVRASVPETEAMGGSVIRGTLWILLGRILPQSYSLVSSVFLARVLGADGLGQLTLITFTAATLATLLPLGFPTSVSRHIAEAVGAGRQDRVAGLYRWFWRFGLAIAGVSAAILLIVAYLGAEPRGAWLLASVSSAALVLHQVPSMLLIGTRNWRQAMIVGTTTGFFSVVIRIGVLLGGGGIVAMVAIDAWFGIVNVVLTALLARRTVNELAGNSRTAAPRYDSELLRRTVRFALIASPGFVITWVVFRRSEIFFLEYFSSSDQIALYSIPFTAVSVLLFLPYAVTYVLGPAFATLFGAGEMHRIRDGFGRSVRIVTSMMIVATAYAIVAGPTALVFFYGEEFEDAKIVLIILLVSAPIVPVWTMSNTLLRSIGKQWFATLVILVAAAVNITLNIVLISAYDALGAALANTSAQAFASLPIFFYARRSLGGLDLGKFVLLRAVFVSLVAGAVSMSALLLPSAPLALVCVTLVFALAFVGLARFVPIFTPSDSRALLERLGERLGGWPRRLVIVVSGGSTRTLRER